MQDTSQFKSELEFYSRHLNENMNLLRAANKVEESVYASFKEKGLICFNTPIVNHGIHEYSTDLAKVTYSENNNTCYLKQSSQFEKQLIVMCGNVPYFQKSSCFRPNDTDKTHIPYHHQLDIEIPYKLSQTTREEALQNTIDILVSTTTQTLDLFGLVTENVFDITYDEALKNYGNDSPYIEPNDSKKVNITVVRNPPWMRKENDEIKTIMHPMAEPVLTSAQLAAFKKGVLSFEEIEKMNVHGFDIIVSAPGIFNKNEKKRGLEIGGGSVRIKNSITQKKIIEMTMDQHIADYMPLICLLEKYDNDEIYTSGGALGFERLTMVACGAKNVFEVQALPWMNNKPPFSQPT